MDIQPDRIRGFIALKLPEYGKRVSLKMQARLKKKGVQGRYTPAENMHITLKFIGDMRSDLIDKVGDILKESAMQCPPIMVRIKGAGVFSYGKNPRIIWAGLESQDGVLERLQGDIDKGLTGIGLSRDKKKFRAHLTLVRLERGSRSGSVMGALSSIRGTVSGPFEVSSPVLFRSKLTPAGPVYTGLTPKCFFDV